MVHNLKHMLTAGPSDRNTNEETHAKMYNNGGAVL